MEEEKKKKKKNKNLLILEYLWKKFPQQILNFLLCFELIVSKFRQ